MTPEQVCQLLQQKLFDAGLNTSIITEANTGSIYLEFEDGRMGKIRIGDHDERRAYGYRWQIRLDIKFPYTDEQKKHKRFFYPPDRLNRCVAHMVNYHKVIERNGTTSSQTS